MRTQQFTFGGANIKGTPAMKPPAVTNDVRKISGRLDIMGVQEFKWRWYWTIIRSMLGPLWGSFPSFTSGVMKPINGAQGIFWRKKLFKKIGAKLIEAFDFSLDNAGIMDNRWIRAVQLQCRLTLLSFWAVSMHAVVGGDERGDGPLRKKFMSQNLERLDQMLDYLTRTDSPIAFEADMNIHQASVAYPEFMALVKKYNGRIIGEHGVEFLVVFDHHCSTKIVVTKNYTLTPKSAGLKTDHEVRCIDFYLQN